MHKPPRIISILILVAFLLYPMHGFAADLPQGGEVTYGNVRVVYGSDGKVLDIFVGSDRVIMNWQQYNIGIENIVNYMRDGGAAFVFLNRVIGGDPSNILGKLNALKRAYFYY
ncbi:MAG: filamentous hemagglutinin N-terminal domain-containing protein [Candidatus Omnitrophota bacterium]|jgi:hypothetical protein